MPTRTIAREHRLYAALEGLRQTRSRRTRTPEVLTERQPRDHRVARRDSTKPVAVFETVNAIGNGDGVSQVAMGYYMGGRGGGFGGEPQ